MIASDRERSVLIRELCKRLGQWSDGNIYQAWSDSTMNAIREDAERLIELLNARELSLYRKRGPVGNHSEE